MFLLCDLLQNTEDIKYLSDTTATDRTVFSRFTDKLKNIYRSWLLVETNRIHLSTKKGFIR